MIDDQQSFDQKIQQLWYTVSTIGIERQAYSGFHVRAASQGISSDPEYVHFLERYVSYNLPRGTELVVVQPEEAPVSLSLIRPADTEHSESILVHRAYIRQEGGDRGGVFFSHLLSKLPQDLSAADALALWEKTSLWQVSDKSLDPLCTELAEVSRETLWPQRSAFSWQRKADKELLRAFLPSLLQAYLEKQAPAQRPEQRQPDVVRRFWRFGAPRIRPGRRSQHSEETRSEKIYIAAADRDVALLIHALALCLPEQFRKTLTFSTYEYNPTTARVEIVGTCWLDHTTMHADSHIPDLLAGIDPREQLVLNCYQPQNSSALIHHPALFPRSVARDYAEQATEYLLLSHDPQKAGPARSQKEADLLSNFGFLFMDAQLEGEMDVERFLALYEENVRNPAEVTDESLRAFFESSHAKKIASKLARASVQHALLQRTLHSSDLLTRASQAIERWHSWHNPELAQAMEQTAHLCQRHLSTIIHNGLSVGSTEVLAGQASLDMQFDHGMRLLCSLTNLTQFPLDRRPQGVNLQIPVARIYLDLLASLQKRAGSYAFFEHHQSIYRFLVGLWSDLLATQERVRGNAENRPVEQLLFILPPPLEHFETFTRLDLDPLWQGLILHTWLKREPARQGLIALLFQRYTWYMQQLFTDLLAHDQTTQHPLYTQGWTVAKNIFWALPRQLYPQKWPLLSALLTGTPPQLVHLLVRRDEFSSGERAAFLRQFGPRYLLDQRLATVTCQILRDLSTDEREQSVKMDVLFTLLESRGPDSWLKRATQQHLARLLNAALLTPQEIGVFLRKSGPAYYRQLPVIPVLEDLLARYLVFYQADYWRWELARWVLPYGQTELAFFQFLLTRSRQPLSAEMGQFFACWQQLIPVLINPQALHSAVLETAAASDAILNDQRLQPSNREYIIARLAVGCLQSRSALPEVTGLLISRLSPQQSLHLLYVIADQASLRVRQNEDLELLEVCIASARAAKRRFKDEEHARTFLRLFLEALLHHTSPVVQEHVHQRAQTWDAELLADWHIYQRTHPLAAVSQPVDPGREKRLKREYRRALRSLASAAKKRPEEPIFRVYMEHLLTIQLRRGDLERKLGRHRWEEIQRVLKHRREFAAFEQAERRSQLEFKTTHLLKKPRFWMRPVFWWRRVRTLSPLARALRSRRMGKIVHCLKDRGSQLDAYRPCFPEEWRALIDPALAFFEACLQEDPQSDEQLKAREQAILQAHQTIMELNKKLKRPLILAEHERERVVFAEQTSAEILRQERQSRRLQDFLALWPALLPR